ncbi:MAG: rhomboid family intramembrane serine protease [Pseudomonadota bacterium]
MTDSIVIITSLAWLAAVVLGLSNFIPYAGGFIPALFGVSADDAARALAQSGLTWRVPADLTPLTATLIHGGFGHVAMNMLTLVFCGRVVEKTLGGWSVIFLYLVGAYAAASAHYFANVGQTVPMIGASGAISAIVGAYAMLFSRSRARRIGPIPAHYVHALWLAAAWTALQWMIGIATLSTNQNIAIAAHIGGFLAGLMFARTLLVLR